LNEPLDQQTIHEVVTNIARALCDSYVFPQIAQQMHDALHAAAHTYDDLTTPESLCEKLTAELQAISHDKHIRVRYNAEPRPVNISDDISPEEKARWTAQARSTNFGFYKVERLDGNIGYLDLRGFCEVIIDGAGDTAVGAMNFLTHTDALIVDLRRNGGGSPSMIALIISFLVGAESVHLNSFYQREGDKTQQFWTLSYIPGRRTPDKPVYVLTSKRTFSGAEEFAYNLKNLKRATLIGETTGGGAHPGREMSVTPHFRVFVPTGRAINPISGTNWEGTGVKPDIALPQEEAFKRAYQLALGDILKKLANSESDVAQMQAEEARAALEKIEMTSETASAGS
jgi:retinol-binding protein 3